MQDRIKVAHGIQVANQLTLMEITLNHLVGPMQSRCLLKTEEGGKKVRSRERCEDDDVAGFENREMYHRERNAGGF